MTDSYFVLCRADSVPVERHVGSLNIKSFDSAQSLHRGNRRDESGMRDEARVMNHGFLDFS